MSKQIFHRGYDELREKIKQNPKYTMSCYNCDFYYQAVGDESEVCQNPSVLRYDMIVTPDRIYCLQWHLSTRKEVSTSGGLFMQKGVLKSGHKKEVLKTGKKSK